jgi:hypothetical protein
MRALLSIIVLCCVFCCSEVSAASCLGARLAQGIAALRPVKIAGRINARRAARVEASGIPHPIFLPRVRARILGD